MRYIAFNPTSMTVHKSFGSLQAAQRAANTGTDLAVAAAAPCKAAPRFGDRFTLSGARTETGVPIAY